MNNKLIIIITWVILDFQLLEGRTMSWALHSFQGLKSLFLLNRFLLKSCCMTVLSIFCKGEL